MSHRPIRGSIVALVTPMLDDGAVDFVRLAELVEWHIAEGTNGIVAVGTTGESATLDVTEHMAVVKAVIATVAGRIPVIAGTGANSTREAIELTVAAKELGADACLVVTPYYNKPPQEGLFQHYQAIASAVDIPILLYNVPGRTGVDLLPVTVARLAQLPNIVGIKEARGELERRQALLDLNLPADFILLSGDDETARESILMGFKGDISVTANIAPKLMSQMCQAALQGDAAAALAADTPLRGLHQHLFVEPNPIPAKWALTHMGKIGPALRLPLVQMSAQYQTTVIEALRLAGVTA